jgi:hypothetical protein
MKYTAPTLASSTSALRNFRLMAEQNDTRLICADEANAASFGYASRASGALRNTLSARNLLYGDFSSG